MRGAGDRPAPLSFCICSDYGVSKNNLDIRKATGCRDIGTYACPGYFIHLIYKEVKHE